MPERSTGGLCREDHVCQFGGFSEEKLLHDDKAGTLNGIFEQRVITQQGRRRRGKDPWRC